MTSFTRRAVLVAALLMVPALASAQPAATDTTTQRPTRHSWTSDRREFAVGDILTVLVDESTLASASKGQSASDAQSRDLGLSAPSALPVDLSLGTNKGSSSRQSGQATRDLRFRGEMTVRVTKIEANGVLEVKGLRTVDVDKNKQQLSLTGFVRPQDVSPINTVASARIADAQVLYTLSGDLGGTRGGIIGRLVSVFWP
ncbi:MAG: flagellar basal body L-ring protein FlgH [bacterium]